MSAAEFEAILERLDLHQIEFARIIEYLSAQTVHYVTVNRWVRGQTRIPAYVTAFIEAFMRLDDLTQLQLMYGAANRYGSRQWAQRVQERIRDSTYNVTWE